MRTIIIPTDFSPAAVNAMNYGLDMALAVNASVILFHAYSVPISMTDVPVMLVSVEELEKNAQQQMRSLKEKAEHVVSGKIKITTESRLGDSVDELEQLCERVQPFVVVMGTRDSSGLERTLFGSTTMAAVRRLKWPVIAVPPGKEYGQGIRKIGFACDFKNVVDSIPAEVIKDLVKEFHAEFHVLNVSPDGKNIDTSEGEFVLLKNMLEDAGPVYEFIKNDDVEEGINEFAETNNLDLVIMIPRKHNLLDGIFKKHHTKKLVFHSHIPVMCAHG
jgi:nucleotide-binding universal stress UspA family protein